MKDHTYELAVTITVKGAEEPTPEPIDHVADAVQRLLADNAHEWLLEAIGHPHPADFEVEAKDRSQEAGEAWVYDGGVRLRRTRW
jgi:hypothetical protein